MQYLLILCFFTSTIFAAGSPDLDEPIPGMSNDQEWTDQAALDFLVEKISTAPEFAGDRVGVRVGALFKVVDRRAEAKSATVPPKDSPVLKAITTIMTSNNAAKASFHISWHRKRTGVDENGKPFVEEDVVEFNAGGAMGAAAIEAQQAMDDAMGKSHK